MELLKVEKDIWNYLESKEINVNFVWLKGRELTISLGSCDLSINQIKSEVDKICDENAVCYDSFMLEI